MWYLQLEEWEQYNDVVSPTERMGTVQECGISNWKNGNSTRMWYLQLGRIGTVQECGISNWKNGNSTRMWYLQLEEW